MARGIIRKPSFWKIVGAYRSQYKRTLRRLFIPFYGVRGGVSLKLCAKYPEKVKKFFDIEGAGYKGYPVYKKENFKSTGEPYGSKEEMAEDPMQVAPMLRVLEKGDEAMMSSVWDATIYTVNKPTREENDIWMAETLKQRNLVDLDWALANLNMSDEYTPYGKGDGSIKNIMRTVDTPPW